MVIQWTPMPRNDWNAPGLKYLIRYRRTKTNKIYENSLNESNKWTEFFIVDPYIVNFLIFLKVLLRTF